MPESSTTTSIITSSSLVVRESLGFEDTNSPDRSGLLLLDKLNVFPCLQGPWQQLQNLSPFFNLDILLNYY
jgi:hypothetical protein